jgi:hypothetical protein
MRLIFIYGLPATGKLTVAVELAAITGYKLFHNHLVVDLALSVFEFGSPPFVELREDIWLSVFEQACRSQLPGLIFSFAPEATVRPSFIGEVLTTVARGGGDVEFVELVCPLAELKRRIGSPSRWPIRSFPPSPYLSSCTWMELSMHPTCPNPGSRSIRACAPQHKPQRKLHERSRSVDRIRYRSSRGL